MAPLLCRCQSPAGKSSKDRSHILIHLLQRENVNTKKGLTFFLICFFNQLLYLGEDCFPFFFWFQSRPYLSKEKSYKLCLNFAKRCILLNPQKPAIFLKTEIKSVVLLKHITDRRLEQLHWCAFDFELNLHPKHTRLRNKICLYRTLVKQIALWITWVGLHER